MLVPNALAFLSRLEGPWFTRVADRRMRGCERKKLAAGYRRQAMSKGARALENNAKMPPLRIHAAGLRF